MSFSLQKREDPDLIRTSSSIAVELNRVYASHAALQVLGIVLPLGSTFILIRGLIFSGLFTRSATELATRNRGLDAAPFLAVVCGCWLLVSVRAVRAAVAEWPRSGLWNRRNMVLLEVHLFALLLVAGLYTYTSSRTITVIFEPSLFRSAVCIAVYLLARIAILRLKAATLVSGALSTSLVLTAWFYSELVRGPVEYTPWVILTEWMLVTHFCVIPSTVLVADTWGLYIEVKFSTTISLPPAAQAMWHSLRLRTLIQFLPTLIGITSWSLYHALQEGGHVKFVNSS